MAWSVRTSYCLMEILLTNNSQGRQPLVDLNLRGRYQSGLSTPTVKRLNAAGRLYAYGDVDRVSEGRYNKHASTQLLNPAFGLVLTPLIRIGAGPDYRGSVGTGRRA